MQTVNFHCPHCKNLMAVEVELLGHQVQCPTCQQVVVAPAAAGSAAPESQVSFDEPARKVEDQDSIFGEVVDEDLFGSRPPKVEIPADAPPIATAAPRSDSRFAVYPPGVPQPAPPTPVEAAAEPPPVAFEVQSATTPPLETPPVSPNGAAPTPPATLAPENWPAAIEPPLPDAPPPSDWQAPAWSPTDEAGPIAPPRRGPTREQRRGANLLLAILGPYSVIMTLVAGWYFYKARYPGGVDHPMANIPDIFGQYEPATRKQLSRRVEGMPPVDAPLPDSLLVRIGETLRVGDLEVTPERIEQGRIRIHTVLQDNQTSVIQPAGEALILHLKLKNRSDDIYFHPTDPVFDRLYDRRQASAKPYTQVVIGGQHFYGGPIDVLTTNWQKVRRKFVDGQDKDDRSLPPGEERQTVICTDPDETRVLQAARDYKGDEPMVWRVQLRRGLTTFRGEDLSVCAVVGVQFTAADLRSAKN